VFISLTVDIVVDMIMEMVDTIMLDTITVHMIMQLTIIQNMIIVMKRSTTTKGTTMEQEDAVDMDTTILKN